MLVDTGVSRALRNLYRRFIRSRPDVVVKNKCRKCLLVFAVLLFVLGYTAFISREESFKLQPNVMLMHNVCIGHSSTYQLPWSRLTLSAYDRTLLQQYGTYKDIRAVIAEGQFYGHWRLYFLDSQEITSDKKFEEGVVFIPTHWKLEHGQSPWSAIHGIALRTFGLIDWARSNGIKKDINWDKMTLHFAAAGIGMRQTKVRDLESLYLGLGFNELINVLWTNTRCFKYGVIGQAEQTSESKQKMAKEIKRSLRIDDSKCTTNKTLIIQRTTTRKLLNVPDLVSALQELDFDNIETKELERLSKLQDQIQTVYCARVIIAVQGAGLAWYPFFQDNAKVVEIIYDHWPSRYEKRFKADRPDIQTLVLNCTRVTSDEVWSRMAWSFFIPHIRVTENLKRKVEEESLPRYPVHGTVWKESDVYCEKQHFKQQLKLFFNKLNK